MRRFGVDEWIQPRTRWIASGFAVGLKETRRMWVIGGILCEVSGEDWR